MIENLILIYLLCWFIYLLIKSIPKIVMLVIAILMIIISPFITYFKLKKEKRKAMANLILILYSLLFTMFIMFSL